MFSPETLERQRQLHLICEALQQREQETSERQSLVPTHLTQMALVMQCFYKQMQVGFCIFYEKYPLGKA